MDVEFPVPKNILHVYTLLKAAYEQKPQRLSHVERLFYKQVTPCLDELSRSTDRYHREMIVDEISASYTGLMAYKRSGQTSVLNGLGRN